MTSSSADRAAKSQRVRMLRRRSFAVTAFALVLAACGGTADVQSSAAPAEAGVDATDDRAAALAAATANMSNLQSAESVFDVEVLSVADGSAASLRDVVTGDRPVLVWFYAPH